MKKMFLSLTVILTLAGCAKEGVLEVTAENFDAVVMQATQPVVIDFHATWCGPCKYIKPLFAELAQEHTDWVFATVDIDQAPDIAATCGVSVVPTFVVFKQGVQWGLLEGGRKKEQLMQEFQKIATRATPEEKTVPSAELQELMTEIVKGDVAAVKRLLAEGVDVNGHIKSPIGDMTPLLIAVSTTQEMIDLLLQAGAHIDDDVERFVKTQCALYAALADKIRTTLAYAREFAQAHKVVKPAFKLTGDVVAERMFAALNDVEALKQLIATGMDVNQVVSLGTMEVTPLLVAMRNDNRAAIDLLIAAGASLETELRDQTGAKKSLATIVSDTINTYEQLRNTSYTNLEYILKRA
jgi:thioredoxin 1